MFGSVPEELIWLDERLFDNHFDPEAARAEKQLLAEREARGEECLPAGAHQSNKHFGARTEPQALPKPVPQIEAVVSQQEQNVATTPYPETYHGIPYARIIKEVVAMLGGEPEVGGRHDRQLRVARHLRSICDYDPEWLLRLIPRWGQEETKVRQLCLDACTKWQNQPMSDQMSTLLLRLESEYRPLIEAEEVEAEDVTTDEGQSSQGIDLGDLPRILQPLVKAAPEAYRESLILSMLPVLGTLGTNVRGRYLDGRLHSPSFIVAVMAPPASGKSYIREPKDLLLKPIREQDEVNAALEREYKEKLRSAKNSKQQPVNPKAMIRLVPGSISNSKLLERLDYAEGKHLFSFVEEVDTLNRTNRTSWSGKSDIYRLSFDNAEYGQDYMSDNSYSCTVNVYYNLLLSGTPAAMHKFFSNTEDGLVTRVLFTELPESIGGRMPRFQPLSKRQLADTESAARQLMEQTCELKMVRTNAALDQWLDQRGREAVEDNNRVIDTLRKRSAVIGFRAAMLHVALNHGRETDAAVRFGLWVAEKAFCQQWRLFASSMQKSLNIEVDQNQNYGSVKRLYDKLPIHFSRELLMKECLLRQKSGDVRCILSRWQKQGLIKKTDMNEYEKIS